MRNDKREPVITIPPVVGLVEIRIQPATTAAMIHVQEIRIAIGIVRGIVYATALRILSGLYRIRHLIQYNDLLG